MPVSGRISVNIQGLGDVRLETDGKDLIATDLFWRRLQGFEKETIPYFLKLLRHAETVLDVGANTGIYTLLAAKQSSMTRVIAFEPVPATVEYLRRNVSINSLSNITIYAAAVAEYDGEIPLYIPDDIYRIIPVSASTLEGFRKNAEILSVPSVTIDSVVARENIPRVDILKIDTEGTEHKVLAGTRNTIRRDEPIIICEVLGGFTDVAHGIHGVLDEFAYHYFWISGEGLVRQEHITGDNTFQCRNYLFVSKKRMQELQADIRFA